MANMWLEVVFRHTADMEHVKSRLSRHTVSYVPCGNETKVVFTGDAMEGRAVLEKVIEEGHCTIKATCGY